MATIDYDAPRDKPWILRSVWMLLSRNKEFINSFTIRVAARPAEAGLKNIPLWTDNFASLFQILRSGAPHFDPAFSGPQNTIADELCQRRDFAGAISIYRSALRTHPDSPDLLNNLAWLQATCPEATHRDGVDAVKYAERACELTHYGVAPIIGTLAAAYAEAGRFDDAIVTARHACELAAKNGETNLVQRNRALIELYQAHKSARSE